MTTDLLGYAHPHYALSLQEFGEPRELPHCGGWILVRPIPGTPYKDATGCYPLFACRDWTKLHEDLEQVCSDLVSLSLVTDPFSEIAPAYLEKCFDIAKPFKTHYIADLSYPLQDIVHKSHKYDARKALQVMDIEISYQPVQYLDDWIRLYNNLISKHAITGINKFSAKCFEVQLSMPGMLMFLGRLGAEVVGATLVLIHDQVAYAHLSAFSSKGYQIGASHGTHWMMLGYCSEHGIRYLDMGGAAGINENPSDGLSKFKKGYSNDRKMVYFCGRVFDRQKYESICQLKQITTANYFPAYRTEELKSKNQTIAMED
jgi:hypothetical protein